MLGPVTGGIPTGIAIATVVLYRLISLGLIIGTGWISCAKIRREQRQLG